MYVHTCITIEYGSIICSARILQVPKNASCDQLYKYMIIIMASSIASSLQKYN